MDLQRWKQMPFSQQMGHITSEITRARVWESKGDEVSRSEALVRALDLLDLTLASVSGPKRREVARLREVLADCLVRAGLYQVSLPQLERYGLQSLGVVG